MPYATARVLLLSLPLLSPALLLPALPAGAPHAGPTAGPDGWSAAPAGGDGRRSTPRARPERPCGTRSP